MSKNILVRRKYLDSLMDLADDPRMKAIMGPAFVGKTVLLNQFRDELISQGVSESDIASISYDRAYIQIESCSEFYGELEKIRSENTKYLLIDSIHVIPQYREAILKFHQTYPGISIYATASTNSIWEQSDIPGFTDNVVFIHLYPFTFREFFQRYPGNVRSQFEKYLHVGGFPFITPDADAADQSLILDGFMNLVAMRIVLRENKTNPRGMAILMAFLFANVSNCLTMKEILQESGVVDSRTLEKYLNRIIESGVMYRCKGYHMDRGMKESAKMMFFAADTLNGSYINLRGLQPTPWRNVIVNIVFTDLKARGYHPDILLYKGEPVSMRIFIGDRSLMIRVDISAEVNMQTESFVAYRISTMDKVFLTLDSTTSELSKYHHMNLITFLMKEDLGNLVTCSDHLKKAC